MKKGSTWLPFSLPTWLMIFLVALALGHQVPFRNSYTTKCQCFLEFDLLQKQPNPQSCCQPDTLFGYKPIQFCDIRLFLFCRKEALAYATSANAQP